MTKGEREEKEDEGNSHVLNKCCSVTALQHGDASASVVAGAAGDIGDTWTTHLTSDLAHVLS